MSARLRTTLHRSLFALATFASLPAMAVQVGDRGKAPWSADNHFYPVEIAAVRGAQCKMHWLIPWQHGAYDEWGPCAGFVHESGVQVNWKGSWYPANVIGYGANCYQIHYTGYDDSWNECVTQDRLRW